MAIQNKAGLSWRIKLLMARYSIRRRFLLWLMPYVHIARDIYLREKVLVVPDRFPAADLKRKVRAATHIAAQGAEVVDISFLAALMSPKKEFTYAEAEREAFAVLDSLLAALLVAMPPAQTSQILKDQAERLFSEE